MTHRIAKFCFFLVIAALFSCGDEFSRKENTRELVKPPTFTQNQPQQSYFFADRSCQTSTEPHTIESVFPLVAGSTGLQLVETPVAMTSDESLSSKAVKRTIYGRHYKRQCNFTPESFGSFLCYDNEGVIASWSYYPANDLPLKICASGRRYDRDAIEAIGLTSATFLDQAKAFFDSIFPTQQLPGVLLEILPQYVTTYSEAPHPTKPDELSNRTVYLVDNLAYSASAQSISVYPESKVSRAKNPDAARLWESPFVLNHEYGHHIEQIMFKRVINAHRLSWHGSEHRYQSLTSIKKSSTSQLGVRLMTALSEAFADSFALYASKDNGASIRAIPQLGGDRHPSDNMLSSANLRKQLNMITLSAFFDHAGLQALSPHQFGAVLAHISDRHFMTAAQHCSNGGTQLANNILATRFLTSYQDHILRGLLDQELSTSSFASVFVKALEFGITNNLGSCSNGFEGSNLRTEVCLESRKLMPAAQTWVFESYCDLPEGQ